MYSGNSHYETFAKSPKSPKFPPRHLGDFGEFCKGLIVYRVPHPRITNKPVAWNPSTKMIKKVV